jgi:hypothetical protein
MAITFSVKMIIENVTVFGDVMACSFLDVSRAAAASTFSVKNKVNMKVMGVKMEVAVSFKTLCYIPETIVTTVIASNLIIDKVYRFCQDSLFFMWTLNDMALSFLMISKRLLFLYM